MSISMKVSGVDLRQETMLAWPCSRKAKEGAETGAVDTVGDVGSDCLSDRFEVDPTREVDPTLSDWFEVDPTWSESECRFL